MSTKHEPGPWILGGCSGRMITTPSGYTGDGFIADVDTLANARLITAAPDFLEAATGAELRELYRIEFVWALIRGIRNNKVAFDALAEDDPAALWECITECEEHVRLTRGAIAKATGA